MQFNKDGFKALVGEFLVTYLFLFTVNYGELPTVPQVIRVFLASVGYIYAFGGISGAHFNPAVTVGAIVGQKISIVQGLLYIVLQVAAGIAAAGTVYGFSTPTERTFYSKSVWDRSQIVPALGIEVISSFILVFVIYATAMGVAPKSIDDDSKSVEAKKNFAGLAIGATLGFLVFLGGAFNPAAVTGPAVISLTFGKIWVVWVGDVIGATLAAALHTYFFA